VPSYNAFAIIYPIITGEEEGKSTRDFPQESYSQFAAAKIEYLTQICFELKWVKSPGVFLRMPFAVVELHNKSDQGLFPFDRGLGLVVAWF
jgi:hypothetical protein